MKKIIAIIGARPQFIKHAPVEKALSKHFEVISIHTGQHYDKEMSDIFFTQLKIREPKYMLNVQSFSHGVQTGKMMIEIEPIIEREKPDAILVYGDTNSTIAGALIAAKLGIKLIHIEAGLRSFNKSMPEEINRIVTDHLSQILFVPSDTAIQNLKNEGISQNVFRVGDVMCDMLLLAQKTISFKKADTEFYYATIHRPYNTDDEVRLINVITTLNKLDKKVKFTVHPRTSSKLKNMNVNLNDFSNIEFLPPVSYFENIEHLNNCNALITDSGGMQKEAYIFKKKCITIRSETEWIETLEGNWNHLVFDDLIEIQSKLKIIPSNYKQNLYGNGNASEEICNELIKII